MNVLSQKRDGCGCISIIVLSQKKEGSGRMSSSVRSREHDPSGSFIMQTCGYVVSSLQVGRRVLWQAASSSFRPRSDSIIVTYKRNERPVG